MCTKYFIRKIYKQAKCGGLIENGSHRFVYLKAWLLVSGTTWEGLEGVALSDEVYHCGWTLGFQKLTPCPVSTILLVIEDKDMSS